MVMIPASIFWFVFGFVSCFALILTWAFISAKKQSEKNHEIYQEFLKNISNNNEDE